jgi:hypothetical protein
MTIETAKAVGMWGGIGLGFCFVYGAEYYRSRSHRLAFCLAGIITILVLGVATLRQMSS